MDELIAELIRLVNSNHGSVYTSTNLRDNPDVCHACCAWFIHNVTSGKPIASILQDLDSTPKSRFAMLQKQMCLGPSIPKKMLTQARSSGKGVGDSDVAAIKHLINVHSQPRPGEYIQDVVTLVANLVVSFSTTSMDSAMIYLSSDSGGGHVICMVRHVGGVLIYDPNIGVISIQMSNRDCWADVLRRIIRWYKTNMGLNKFAYMAK
ncbi:MAG: hypothetical protein VYA55_17350 [Pseudomonadota bacterium]|nr:hypothetical protein [Pseudomonadota bacterium]